MGNGEMQDYKLLLWDSEQLFTGRTAQHWDSESREEAEPRSTADPGLLWPALGSGIILLKMGILGNLQNSLSARLSESVFPCPARAERQTIFSHQSSRRFLEEKMESW